MQTTIQNLMEIAECSLNGLKTLCEKEKLLVTSNFSFSRSVFEMAECSLNGLKTLCEKEKLLVTSNFTFSRSVFKRLVLQTRENQTLFGKRVKSSEPNSSVGSVADLRTGGRWIDPRLGQYSFPGLMIVIATGFIPLSPLSVASTMVYVGKQRWFGKNIVRSTG